MMEASRDEMDRVVVGRRETCEREFHISSPGTVLRWEFVTIDHGISFGWYHKATETTKSSNAFNVVSIAIGHIITNLFKL